MTSEEQKTIELADALGLKQEKQRIENPGELLQNSLTGLDKFGGFQLLKGLVKGVENMDPRRKAIKNIFLTDSAYAETRTKLLSELSLWLDILENEEKDPMAIIDSCQKKRDQAERNLRDNLFSVRDEIKNLEVTYRSLDSLPMQGKERSIVSRC